MPTPEEFFGADFALESVEPVGLATLRVRFTQYPKAVDESETDDGLNPANYILSGPSLNYITSALAVADDPQAIDVYLAAALDIGTWTLAVANTESDTASSLVAPTSLDFLIDFTATQTPVSGGAVNMDVVNVLRKHFNPALKGPGWDSMLAALAAGDRINWDNAKLAFDQLFVSTASGSYLEKRAADSGIRKPSNMSMSDALFRELAIIEKTRQLTQDAVLSVLEVFYGRDVVRAFSTTQASEPFELEDGDDLRVLLDDRDDVRVVFNRSSFARIGKATALEVAAVITQALRTAGSQGQAIALTDHLTGDVAVRIYSGRKGISAGVQVLGGRAQTKLLFPTSLFESSGSSPFADWTIELSPTTPGNVRFTLNSGIFDLSLVQQGDSTYVYGSEFDEGNIGVFEIQDVSVYYSGVDLVQWFEISNPSGTAQASVSQTLFIDLMFFRPKKRTIYDESRHISVAQAEGELDVSIPATTQAVGRQPGQAAYLQSAEILDADTLVRSAGIVTVTTPTAHGLVAGHRAIIDGAIPTGDGPSVSAGVPSVDFSADVANGTTDATLKSFASEAGTFIGVDHKALRLQEGFVMVVGGRSDDSTTIPNPILFEVVSESTLGDGSRRQSYRWTDLVDLAPYASARRDFGSCVMADGRVLLTGGTNENEDDPDSASASDGVDIITYVRTPPQVSNVAGTLPGIRSAHAQCALADGGAIISGGWDIDIDIPIDTTYFLNPSTLLWSARAAMKFPRKRHEMVLLDNDEVLAIGGLGVLLGSSGAALNSCEIYNSGADTWRKTGILSQGRHQFGSLRLPDGRVLVVGGLGFNPTRTQLEGPLATCEVFDRTMGLWQKVPSLSVARIRPIVVYLSATNVVMVAGGGSTKIELLDLSTMTWSTSAATLATGLESSAGAIADDDTVIVAGGVNEDGDTQKLNYITLPGQDAFARGGLNGEVGVLTVPSSTSFTFSTEAGLYGDYTEAADGVKVTPVTAPESPAGLLGPFVFDPNEGVAITGTEADLVTTIESGNRYPSVVLSDASSFPDSIGYLVFDFGKESVAGPVKYLGRISSTELLLDTSFVFPLDISPGAKVSLLSGRGPYQPSRTEHLSGFYITGSAAGRVAAEAVLDDTVAAGIRDNVTVVYPGTLGMGGDGNPTSGSSKLSDAVEVWGGDSIDEEIAAARSQS